MKKIILVILSSILFITGCDTMNTPTKRTEEYLSKYTALDKDVVSDVDLMVETENLGEENSKTYKKVIERQLKDMKYEIVSEEVDGDTATVTAKITVYDLYKEKTDANTYYQENPTEFYDDDNKLDDDKYNKYSLDKMLKTKSTVDYTIEVDLAKVDDTWTIQDIDNTTKEKIYGLYNYGRK